MYLKSLTTLNVHDGWILKSSSPFYIYSIQLYTNKDLTNQYLKQNIFLKEIITVLRFLFNHERKE